MAEKKKTTTAQRAGQYMKEASEESKFYLARMKKSQAFRACSPRERLFAINYVLHQGDVSLTMKATGATSKYYSRQAHMILKRDKVQLAIREFWDALFLDKIDKIQKVMLDQLYRRAFTARSKYFDKYGHLKDDLTLEDLGPDECIIDGIETKFYGKDADVRETVFKLADRNVAYRELQKLLGLDKKNTITNAGKKTTGVLKVAPPIKEEEWVKLN